MYRIDRIHTFNQSIISLRATSNFYFIRRSTMNFCRSIQLDTILLHQITFNFVSSIHFQTINNIPSIESNNQQQHLLKHYMHNVTGDSYSAYSENHVERTSVTATPKPTTINLSDIFITVKTTKMYHDTRLALIIKTWFQLAKEQVSRCM